MQTRFADNIQFLSPLEDVDISTKLGNWRGGGVAKFTHDHADYKSLAVYYIVKIYKILLNRNTPISLIIFSFSPDRSICRPVQVHALFSLSFARLSLGIAGPSTIAGLLVNQTLMEIP